ncbi:hypothetical protein OESDEN_05224 [Oesophagostomum dentatum]|uniref:Uncharacterized protein n=1 Tax=Oesophagostomum dentatum TaxID=61180 RepID=A0A0B1THF2_OESDE|nr:hypothetical protein OESDEN_05224 [Oesophagostomum dentatum]
MRALLLILSLLACASALYETQPSGYGSNNPSEVQKVAQKSPKNRPVDYSAISYNTKKTGSYKLRRNKSEVIEKQTKIDGDAGSQTKGDQQTSVTINRTDNQNVIERFIPYYDAPRYKGGAIVIPILHNYARTVGELNMNGNEIDTSSLGQIKLLKQASSSGSADMAKLSQESSQNYFDPSRYINTAPPAYMPFMDAPNYIGGGGYAGAPIYIPNFEFLTKNNYYTRLEQVS